MQNFNFWFNFNVWALSHFNVQKICKTFYRGNWILNKLRGFKN